MIDHRQQRASARTPEQNTQPDVMSHDQKPPKLNSVEVSRMRSLFTTLREVQARNEARKNAEQ